MFKVKLNLHQCAACTDFPISISDHQQQSFSRPHGGVDVFKQNKPLSRYQEINTDFKPLRPKKSPKVPKLELPELPKLDLPKLEIPKFPNLKPFSEEGFGFGTSRPPVQRKDPKFEYVDTKPLKAAEEKPEDLYNLENPVFRPPQFEPEPELTRPKRRRPAPPVQESDTFRPDFDFDFPELPVQRPGRQVFNRYEESSRPNRLKNSGRPNLNRFDEPALPEFSRFDESALPEFNRIESSTPDFNRFNRFEEQSRPGFNRFEEVSRPGLNRVEENSRPVHNRFEESSLPNLDRFENSRPGLKRFEGSSRPSFNRYEEPSRPSLSRFEEYVRPGPGSRPSPPYVEDDSDFNQIEKPQTRLKRKFPFSNRQKPGRKRFPDERLKFRGLPARPYFEERDSNYDRNSVGPGFDRNSVGPSYDRNSAVGPGYDRNGPGVYRTTTPRPIPTPGPGDFPMPPPGALRPRPPPTHPTHPPLVTHPPEHYDAVTRLPPSFNEVQQTKLNVPALSVPSREVDFSRDYDNSIQEDEGFFAYPGTFPSLEDLGAGFESMKIRRSGKSRSKRSAEKDPLMTSEARRRRRILRGRGNRRGLDTRR